MRILGSRRGISSVSLVTGRSSTASRLNSLGEFPIRPYYRCMSVEVPPPEDFLSWILVGLSSPESCAILLEGVGDRKIPLIMAVRELARGLNLSDAKDLV